MANVNYIAVPVNEGTTVSTTRRVYNQITRQAENVTRSFAIVGQREDGSLELEALNETFQYNNASYAVRYVGENRR